MIKLTNVSKKYGKIEALNQITLDVHKGQCVALVGPNGSGKTTFIKSILSMIKIDEGTINFRDADIKGDDLYRASIGYMPQVDRYPDRMRVHEVFDLVRGIRGDIDDPVVDLDLFEHYKLAMLASQKMHTLSGGTRQKVSAALAFMFSPDVLLLDEPMAGLDPVSASILRDKIRDALSAQKLIIISSHLLGQLDDLYSHILYLREGRVLFYQSRSEVLETTGESLLLNAVPALIRTEMQS